MVDNEVLDYVKSELGRAINQYHDESPLTDEESKSLFEDFSWDTGLENLDALILHESNNEEENGRRYELFNQMAFYLQASGNNPKMFVPEEFREEIETSNDIHSDSVEYIESGSTTDELEQVYDRFLGTGRVQITSDDDIKEVYKSSKMFDEDEFVIFSTKSSK
jgi:hypothetical protein